MPPYSPHCLITGDFSPATSSASLLEGGQYTDIGPTEKATKNKSFQKGRKSLIVSRFWNGLETYAFGGISQ